MTSHQKRDICIMRRFWEHLWFNEDRRTWAVMRFDLQGDLAFIPAGTPYMAGPFAHTICHVRVNKDGSGSIKWVMPESYINPRGF